MDSALQNSGIIRMCCWRTTPESATSETKRQIPEAILRTGGT